MYMQKDSYENIHYLEYFRKLPALSMVINLFLESEMIKLTDLNIESRITPS